MYSKLYARITESSLMEEAINVRYTFVMMLAIADPEGYVIGTNVAIARRLNMQVDEFEECLAVLMAPDPHSNSKELDGRRVVVSNGERGYHIVNYVNYRDLKDQKDRREYMREYMRKRRHAESQTIEDKGLTESVNKRKLVLTDVRQEEEDVEGDVNVEEEALHPVGVAWNSSDGIVPIRTLSKDRLRKLATRLKDKSWDWQQALSKFPLRLFASQPEGWKPTFDWFIRPDTVTAIIEGKYDWVKVEQNGVKNYEP